RVLVAGRSAILLADVARTCAPDLYVSSATTTQTCRDLLERFEFDLLIACERLDDGLGLEVLSHAAVNFPSTLRVFAARPSTLGALDGELGPFVLFRTLTYPLNRRKLSVAVRLAQACLEADSPAIGHVVLSDAEMLVEPEVLGDAEDVPVQWG